MFCLTFVALNFPPSFSAQEQLAMNYPVGHLPTLYLRREPKPAPTPATANA